MTLSLMKLEFHRGSGLPTITLLFLVIPLKISCHHTQPQIRVETSTFEDLAASEDLSDKSGKLVNEDVDIEADRLVKIPPLWACQTLKDSGIQVIPFKWEQEDGPRALHRIRERVLVGDYLHVNYALKICAMADREFYPYWGSSFAGFVAEAKVLAFYGEGRFFIFRHFSCV